jgi:hypothetical protein
MKRTDAYRKDCLRDLELVWAQFPELRLGQLIENAAHETPIFYIEDGELVKRLYEFLNEHRK